MKPLIASFALALLLASPFSSGAEEAGSLKLATTTSTYNSGLLDHILPRFEERFDLKVRVIPVGTGKALKLMENGDADAVMVHAPKAEEKFVRAGLGVNRRSLMKNDFVIVGPPADPAELGREKTLKGALEKLKSSQRAVFVSRGDGSGTHSKEMELWEAVNGPPPRERLLDIGQGMEAALRMADQKRAYTLADRGTFLALEDSLDLFIVFEGDRMLDNPYSVIAVNPARWPHANYIGAMLLIAWLTSPEGQAMIGEYKVHDTILFKPTAVPGAAKEK